LTNLQHFYVNSNQLTGTIPALTGLTSLSEFYVGKNQLSGFVPDVVAPGIPQFAGLCPNLLTLVDDPDWDIATGYTPWWSESGGECDILFQAGFDVP